MVDCWGFIFQIQKKIYYPHIFCSVKRVAYALMNLKLNWFDPLPRILKTGQQMNSRRWLDIRRDKACWLWQKGVIHHTEGTLSAGWCREIRCEMELRSAGRELGHQIWSRQSWLQKAFRLPCGKVDRRAKGRKVLALLKTALTKDISQ